MSALQLYVTISGYILEYIEYMYMIAVNSVYSAVIPCKNVIGQNVLAKLHEHGQTICIIGRTLYHVTESNPHTQLSSSLI